MVIVDVTTGESSSRVPSHIRWFRVCDGPVLTFNRYQRDLLLNLCVEVCLPPLQLIDGKCLDLGLSVATDLVDNLTDDLGLTNGGLGLGDGLGGNGLDNGLGNGGDGILGLGLGGVL